MKVLVFVLSLAAAGFAASTVYLAKRLHDVRSGVQSESAIVDVDAPAPVREPSRSGALPEVSAAPTVEADRPVTASAAASEPADSRSKQIQREMAAAFMKRYQDPAGRAEMLADAKASLRMLNRRLAERTGLSEDEAGQLFELLARHQLETSAALHACTLDSLCNSDNFNFPDEQRHVAEVAAFFGPDRYRKYEQFVTSGTERALVEQLRRRTIDTAMLPNSQADKLITALWDEKRQFLADAKRRGLRLTVVESGLGTVIVNADEQGRPRGLASSEMAEFQARVRARAARMLSPEQLKEFEQLLAQAERSVRRPRNSSGGPPAASR